jgi:hypothetical protein
VVARGLQFRTGTRRHPEAGSVRHTSNTSSAPAPPFRHSVFHPRAIRHDPVTIRDDEPDLGDTDHMTWGKTVVTIGVVLALGGGLGGCATISAGQCVDWVPLSPSEQEREASLVVDADLRPTDRTVEALGRYRVREADITSVRKGHAPGDRIDVIATSDQCTSSGEPVEYVDGDPLAEPGSYRLYLTKEQAGGAWRLVVPGAAQRLDD